MHEDDDDSVPATSTFLSDARQIEGIGVPKNPKAHKDMELWKTWQESGRKPEHLGQLVRALEPIIRKQVKNKPPEIPLGAYDQQVRSAVLKSIKSFKPDMGTQLSTHVHHGLRRVTEFVAASRNFGRITSKTRFDKYQSFLNAQKELEDELGKPPTVQELQDRLQWPRAKDVQRMKKEIRGDVFGPTGADAGDTAEHSPSAIRSLIGVMPGVLNAEEKKVFHALYPTTVSGGAEDTGAEESISSISKSLKMRPDRVYRVRSRILSKINPYLKKV